VFSSGTTISSSQMNENFRFLASEIRETEVYCDSGDTISEAINAGYNSLIVYGTCNTGLFLTVMDTNVFGISESNLPNKAASFLILKGGDSGNNAKIFVPEGAMFAVDNAYLQLDNIEMNFSEIWFGHSLLRSENSTINGDVTFAKSTSTDIYNTTFNGQVSLWHNGSLVMSNSTINGTLNADSNSSIDINSSSLNFNCSDRHCISLSNSSSANIDQSNINISNSTNNGDIFIGSNSVANLYNLSFTGTIRVSKNGTLMTESLTLSCGSGSACINIDHSSYLEFDTSNVSSVDTPAIELHSGSGAWIMNSSVSRTDAGSADIHLNSGSNLDLGNNNVVLSVSCYNSNVINAREDDTYPAQIDSSCAGSEASTNIDSGSGWYQIGSQITNFGTLTLTGNDSSQVYFNKAFSSVPIIMVNRVGGKQPCIMNGSAMNLNITSYDSSSFTIQDDIDTCPKEISWIAIGN
jgi:hypothetical protein